QQPLRAIEAPICRGLHELLDGRTEFEAQLFHALAKRVPRVEPVLTSDDGLCVVQREERAREVVVRSAPERREDAEAREGGAVARARGMEQILRLSLELFEVGALG